MEYEIALPQSAEILKAGMQDSNVFIWVKLNPDLPRINRMFHMYETGKPLPVINHGGNRKHIDTVISEHWVCHVFEIVN